MARPVRSGTVIFPNGTITIGPKTFQYKRNQPDMHRNAPVGRILAGVEATNEKNKKT
jgi:hypothetical protein